MQGRPLSARVPVGIILGKLCRRVKNGHTVRIDEIPLTAADKSRIVIAGMSRPRIQRRKFVPDICLIPEEKVKVLSDFKIQERVGPCDPVDAAVREDAIHPLIKLCAQILSPDPLFFLVNSYTTGLAPAVLTYLLATELKKFDGSVESQEIGLPVTQSGLILPCGASG